MPHSEGAAQLTFAMGGKPTRCAACQLQLCKGRGERPHAALTEVGRDESEPATRYTCQKCSAVIVQSGDPSRPGWSHRR